MCSWILHWIEQNYVHDLHCCSHCLTGKNVAFFQEVPWGDKNYCSKNVIVRDILSSYLVFVCFLTNMITCRDKIGFDFAIRTPCTPSRWEEYYAEMTVAWEVWPEPFRSILIYEERLISTIIVRFWCFCIGSDTLAMIASGSY